MLSAAFQPPDQSTADDQQNRNQLRSRHQPTENFTASGIVAQELYEVPLDSVQDHEAAKHLPIEPLALEQPHQQQEIEKLGCGFDQLRRFDPDAERSSTNGIRQRIREDDAPKVIGRFAVTAARREATKAPEDVAKGQSGSEGVGGAQHRHAMAPHVPSRHEERANQSAGKYASRLQRVEAENLPPVVRVGAPVVDDVKNLRPDNSGKDNENAKIPGIVAVHALLLCVAHGDPEPDQHARGDQDTIGGQVETANVKKSGEHVSLDAPAKGRVQKESSRKRSGACADVRSRNLPVLPQ